MVTEHRLLINGFEAFIKEQFFIVERKYFRRDKADLIKAMIRLIKTFKISLLTSVKIKTRNLRFYTKAIRTLRSINKDLNLAKAAQDCSDRDMFLSHAKLRRFDIRL